MSKNKIITLTMNPAIDKSVQVDRLIPSVKLRCQQPVFTPGGGGINVARVIHHLGSDVKAIYSAGGATGDMLENLLVTQGIRQCRINTKTWTRENLAIIEKIKNVQYRFEMPGSKISKTECSKTLETVLKQSQDKDFLIASGSLPPGVTDDFYLKLAKRIGTSNLKLIVDTSGKALKNLIGSGVFLLKPNLREFRELTGQELLNEKDQKCAANKLIENGTCQVVVLSLGAEGIILVTHDLQVKLHSPIVVVKSRIGAGDSTVAGIAVGLTEGMKIKEAVMFGISCGAATVMSPGNELCQKDDVKRIFRRVRKING